MGGRLKMKKLLTNIATALYLTLAPAAVQAAPPAKASVEVMAGDKSVTLDTKLIKPLGEGFGLFNRNRVTLGYQGAESIDDVKVSSFHVLKLTYAIPGVDGLKTFAGSIMVPGGKVDPIMGMQYAQKFADFTLYQEIAMGMNNPTSPTITWLSNLSYTAELTDGLKLVTNVEGASNFGELGHNFSVQRFRLGLDINGYQFGAAADLTEKGNDVAPRDVGYNLGAFVKKVF